MGYATTLYLTSQNTTNDNFRAWGSAIANGFANSGWTKAAGTGTHIDWSTVGRATTAGTYSGYEIWEMQDSLQATGPILVKLEYGCAAVGNTSVGMRVSHSSSANASGNLTGNVSPLSTLDMNGGQATPQPMYLSGDTGRIVFVWGDSYTRAILFGIERILDANGAPTNTGVHVFTFGGGSASRQYSWTPTTSNIAAVEGNFGALPPTQNGTVGYLVSGLTRGREQLAVYPIFHTKVGGFYPPCTILMGYVNSSLEGDKPLTNVPVYGTSHTYMPVTNAVSYIQTNRGNAFLNWLVRYE